RDGCRGRAADGIRGRSSRPDGDVHVDRVPGGARDRRGRRGRRRGGMMPTADQAAHHLQLARDAHARGDSLLHLQLDVSLLTGEKSSWGSAGNTVANDESVGYFLSDVERIGWRLEHTG